MHKKKVMSVVATSQSRCRHRKEGIYSYFEDNAGARDGGFSDHETSESRASLMCQGVVLHTQQDNPT